MDRRVSKPLQKYKKIIDGSTVFHLSVTAAGASRPGCHVFQVFRTFAAGFSLGKMTGQPILLHIETATEICSVALSRGTEIIGVREAGDGNSHSSNLIPFISCLLSDCRLSCRDLNGIAVSVGPGSYTGLRIGVSSAKGMAYALSLPVITVLTLESLAWGARAWWAERQATAEAEAAGCPQFVAMIDARRMEVFTARYDWEMNMLQPPAAVIVDDTTFDAVGQGGPAVFCGNGMPKCKELLSAYPGAHFCGRPASAQFLLPAALRKWKTHEFADTAYFEPFYLKEYVAGKPKVKGLR